MILDYNDNQVFSTGVVFVTPSTPVIDSPTTPGGNVMQTIAIEGTLDSFTAEISGYPDRPEE